MFFFFFLTFFFLFLFIPPKPPGASLVAASHHPLIVCVWGDRVAAAVARMVEEGGGDGEDRGGGERRGGGGDGEVDLSGIRNSTRSSNSSSEGLGGKGSPILGDSGFPIAFGPLQGKSIASRTATRADKSFFRAGIFLSKLNKK